MVYFIAQGNKVKIGTTNNIKQRKKSLSTSSPLPLILLCTVDGDKNIEKQIHTQFHKYKIRGEWFIFSEELQNYINQNNQMNVYVEMINGVIKIFKKMKI